MKELMDAIKKFDSKHHTFLKSENKCTFDDADLFISELHKIDDNLNKIIPNNLPMEEFKNYKLVSEYEYCYTKEFVNNELRPAFEKRMAELREQVQDLKNVISFNEVARVKELMSKGMIDFDSK